MIHKAAIAAALVVAFGARAAPEAPKPVPLPEATGEVSGERQVRNRVILFTDDNRASVPELHLAQ